MHIGNTVRETRKRLKMSLSELAEKSGVQIATLSRIEHNRMTGTLASHVNIARALEVDLTHFYSNIGLKLGKDSPRTIKPASLAFIPNDRATREILANDVLSKRMMPVILKIEGKGKTKTEINPAGTEIFVFVLEGKTEVHLGEEIFILSKSHSLYFNAAVEHSFVNVGKTPARLLCVTTPVAL